MDRSALRSFIPVTPSAANFVLIHFPETKGRTARDADAFLTKRVGDILLFMGVVALSAWGGSMEFTDLYSWSADAEASGLLSPLAGTLLGLGLIAGPMGKCAQFPMHLWLDEAMEGPNPASILRNSVVVTAGALVLFKVMPLLRLAPVAITSASQPVRAASSASRSSRRNRRCWHGSSCSGNTELGCRSSRG